MGYKFFFTKIRNIFPYLYSRVYQSMCKTASERNPHLRSFLLICIIKTIYVFVFILIPINVIFFDNPLFFLLPFPIGLVFGLDSSLHKKYKEKVYAWDYESELIRKKKMLILILFCITPFLLYIPILMISKQFSFVM